MSLSYFTVTQSVAIAAPTPSPATGSVVFTPSVDDVYDAADDQTIYLETVFGYLAEDGLKDDTGKALRLVDNVGLGLAVGQLTYLVSYNIDGKEDAPQFRIAAPGNGAAVDLADPANQLPA